MNGASAVRPELSPVAVTSWRPGRAEAGIWTLAWKAPDGSVVAEPRASASKVRSTVSVGPNPRPWTTVEEVGGPTVRVSRRTAPTPGAEAAGVIAAASRKTAARHDSVARM